VCSLCRVFTQELLCVHLYVAVRCIIMDWVRSWFLQIPLPRQNFNMAVNVLNWSCGVCQVANYSWWCDVSSVLPCAIIVQNFLAEILPVRILKIVTKLRHPSFFELQRGFSTYLYVERSVNLYAAVSLYVISGFILQQPGGSLLQWCYGATEWKASVVVCISTVIDVEWVYCCVHMSTKWLTYLAVSLYSFWMICCLVQQNVWRSL